MPFCLAGRVWSAAVCAERAVCWPTSARRWWIWWRRWLNASITGRWMPRVAAADSRGMALQVLQRLGDRLLMRGTDLRGGLEPAKPVQQAHTLGRAEGQVEPGDAVATGRAAQPLRRDRMGAGEQAVQPLLSDLSGQPELLCRLAEPVAGRLPRPGVVLLLASRDSVQVVVGLALQELADVEHADPRGARRGLRCRAGDGIVRVLPRSVVLTRVRDVAGRPGGPPERLRARNRGADDGFGWVVEFQELPEAWGTVEAQRQRVGAATELDHHGRVDQSGGEPPDGHRQRTGDDRDGIGTWRIGKQRPG